MANLKVESKIFDTDTVKGLKSAERYKARLESKYDKVTVTTIGLNRVYIEGKTQVTPETLAAKFQAVLTNYSPKMAALLGAVIGHDFGVRDGQGNQVTSLSITADGFVIGHTPDPDSSPFIGSADDLDRNLALVLADAKLNADEAALYTTLLFQNVKDWRI